MRSVTMDCQISNHHVRYREHIIFEGKLLLRVRSNKWTNVLIDLDFQKLYVLTGAAKIGIAI
jgi:hypothetical protein